MLERPELYERGRINWNQWQNKLCKKLLEECIAYHRIGLECKLTVCQVAYRAKQLGLGCRAYRLGLTHKSQERIHRCVISCTVKPRQVKLAY